MSTQITALLQLLGQSGIGGKTITNVANAVTGSGQPFGQQGGQLLNMLGGQGYYGPGFAQQGGYGMNGYAFGGGFVGQGQQPGLPGGQQLFGYSMPSAQGPQQYG